MRLCTLALLTTLAIPAAHAADLRCAAEAKAQAMRLLEFHVGADVKERKSVEAPTAVAPLKNPVAPSQVFSVLQVDGHVSPRGRYRMRLIFAPPEVGCVLMGQEILELARL